MMPNGGWGVLATLIGVIVPLASAVLGYFALKYKASAGSVDDLKDRLAAAGAKVERLKADHDSELERLNARIDEADEAEKLCRAKLKKMAEELQQHRLHAVEILAQVKGLTLEVTRLTAAADRSSRPAIITATLDGVITGTSDEVFTLFGWCPEELIGSNVSTIIAPDYEARHREALRMAKERGGVRGPDVAVVGHGLHRDGSLIPVLVTLTSLASGLVKGRISRRTT